MTNGFEEDRATNWLLRHWFRRTSSQIKANEKSFVSVCDARPDVNKNLVAFMTLPGNSSQSA
jgi:hypothetical protein